MLGFFMTSFAQVDCSTYELRDAKETALFLWLPTTTGCAGTISYDIDFRPASGGFWQSVNPFYSPYGNPTSFAFFGLTACTEYEVRVRVLCDGTQIGECIDTFRTEGCPELDCNDVNIANVTTTTADLIVTNQTACADPTSGEFVYHYRLRKTSDPWPAGYTSGISTGTIPLTGLDACTEYEYEIYLNCGGLPTTVCTGTFTTLCGTCSGITVTNIGETSADIVLNGFDDCRDGGVLGFDLRYREAGGNWVTLNGLTSAGSIYNLIGLTACTVYQYEITIKCNGQEITCDGSFNTIGCEVIPCDGVTVPYVGENIAFVQWTGFEDCQKFGTYTIRYEIYNHTTMQWIINTVNVGQNYIPFQNLDPCTEYTVRIAIECDGILGKFCEVTFTTGGDCLVSGGGSGSRKMAAFNQTQVNVFPNPFRQEVNLEFGLNATEEVTVVLHDMMGREIYRHVGTYGAGLQRVAIDGQELPTGILFYTVQAGEETLSGRIVKQ